MFNLSGRAIKKWAKKYNIDYRKLNKFSKNGPKKFKFLSSS
jgi:hypothetical protein